MKSKQALDKFGEFFISNLRDAAIDHHLKLEKAFWKAPALLDVQEKLRNAPEQVKQLVRRCVAEAVDSASHDFLFALQEAHDRETGIQVIVDGENIAAASDGLQGEPYGDGWITQFSKFPEDWAER